MKWPEQMMGSFLIGSGEDDIQTFTADASLKGEGLAYGIEALCYFERIDAIRVNLDLNNLTTFEGREGKQPSLLQQHSTGEGFIGMIRWEFDKPMRINPDDELSIYCRYAVGEQSEFAILRDWQVSMRYPSSDGWKAAPHVLSIIASEVRL